MFSRAANSFAKSTARRMRSSSSTFQRRAMGGHGAAMEGSPAMMHQAAEVFGVITWLWIFSRARADLPWILGFRHPWDHVEDPFNPSPSHGHGGHGGEASSSSGDPVEAWDKFTMKAIKPGEDDDDDEDEEDEDEDEEDDDDDE